VYSASDNAFFSSADAARATEDDAARKGFLPRMRRTPTPPVRDPRFDARRVDACIRVVVAVVDMTD
jgi:hypothetical protein